MTASLSHLMEKFLPRWRWSNGLARCAKSSSDVYHVLSCTPHGMCVYIYYIYIYILYDRYIYIYIYIYIIWYDIVIYMWYSKQPGKKTWYVTKKTFVFCHWHGSLWIIPTSMALPVLQTCWFHLQQTVLDCKPGWWLFCLFLHVFAGCVPFIAGFELVCLPELLTKSD